MPTLVVEKGSDKGKSILVPVAGTMVVGRDTSTVLPLRDTMTSRMHFKIESRPDGFWVDDLGSMNGTYLNGAKLRQPVQLDYGDLIKAGETLFTFQADDAAASTATLSGQKVGGYRIIERIGRGGMGTVYKAEQVDLQRLVALKVISDEHTKDKEFVELFIHEARAAAKLNHPNIVQVYDVKRHGESYYFSMEYVSGGSVQEVLNRQRRVGVDEGVAMILDAARGLEYAHKKGIVHRDVKPDNFMISETGTIKIGDMGLARGLDEKVGPEEETSVIGTPHYIAPEQVLGQPADFRSDIYSLGATFYRMLTGVTPFSAASVRDLVNRKVREEAPPAHEHAPDIPKGLSAIVSRMMAREPAKRYQSMAEVIAGLEKFQRGQIDTAELRTATGPIGLAGNRKTIAIAAAALLVVGLAVWALRGPGPGPSEPPAPRGHDLQLAAQMLENAKLFERTRMDRNDLRSIDKAMQEYEEVFEKFPGTPYAAKAVEFRESLARVRREIAAERQLGALEQAEEAAHRKTAESVRSGRPDYAPIDDAAAAHEAFAAGEAAAGTAAAERARAGAARAKKWRASVAGLKEKLDRALERSTALRAQGKFREAQSGLGEVREEAKRLEADPTLGKGRYAELIVDDLASKEADRVASDARAAWMKTETDARSMASDGGYEGAIRLVDAAAGDSVEELASSAKALRESLEQEWAMVTRRLLEERAELEAKALAKAREEFEAQSRLARALAQKYDFAGALAKLKALRDANGADELKARLDRRVTELERCVHLKDNLINVIRARGNPYRFRKEFDGGAGIQSTIEDADERGLLLALGPGGTTTHGWNQFSPAAFYEFLRAHWKYSILQRKDASEQCDVVAFLMEFGLYEEALGEVEAILKESAASAPEAVRRFCEEYKARLEKGESAENSEVEAEKRLGRLEAFMKRSDLAAAKSEFDLLKGRYGKTRAVQGAAADLERHRERIEKEGGDSLKKSMSEDRHRALMARVQEEQGAAKRAMADVLLRLQKLDDAFERNVHLGSVHAAAGDWRSAESRFKDARGIAEQMIERKLVGPEFLPVYGAVCVESLRVAYVLKDRKTVEYLRNPGAKRFVNPETKMEEKWWADAVETLSSWSESVLPQEERKLPRLREEVRAAPDDPQRVWTLAQSLSEGLAQGSEARGYYAWLIENHPDFSQVQNGNALYRYAELLYQSREIAAAQKRYHELVQMHKEHPKLAEVRRRLDECIRLLNRLGSPKDRK